ncbi:HNH endonuclease family protein [Symbioplanes lichenis]|uniref:HNH endonuclease family protein n=1 Tax=Symbioplanes lichenis TaxID=1629072 RepID=UPI003F68D409
MSAPDNRQVKRILALLVTATLALTTQVVTTGAADAAPPGTPTAATARTYLATLTVAASTHTTTYDRELFPHWSTVSGSCNTRETVLKRDGSGVVTDSACASASGSWYSVYDGATWTAASDVDIDHMVPLKNAWISGAWAWTTAERENFANDLTNPQLLAVTDNVNQSKGDKAPDSWVPPLTSYHCTYARQWIKVKYVYDLTVTSTEKSKLTSMLATC